MSLFECFSSIGDLQHTSPESKSPPEPDLAESSTRLTSTIRFLLGIMSALFIGFSFYKQKATSSGLQNSIFAVFMLVT